MQWRATVGGRKQLVPGYSYTDGLDAAQALDPSVEDVDKADGCLGECYCDEDQGAGYTYDDEFGSCHHCFGDCDCMWLSADDV